MNLNLVQIQIVVGEMNAVYGLPRFEIESVRPLYFLSGNHIFLTIPMTMLMIPPMMMMNIALPQILPWSWHYQILTCMFISKEYLRTRSRFCVLCFWPRPGWEFYAQNRKAQIICGCVNEVVATIFMVWTLDKPPACTATTSRHNHNPAHWA